jgi:adenosylmethionine---8-amino-7-oxononanoate aminotransferase
MSDSLVSRDAAHLWHPFTQHGADAAPLPVRRAHGALLELEDGRELIDAVSSWWTCLHGHAHPRLVEAMRAQASSLDHVLFAGTTHESAVRLGEELVRATPDGLTRVFFSDNGSTAVEVALKMAYHSWVHTGEKERTLFITLEDSYHGDTFGAMSVGDPVPFFAPYAPLLFDVQRIPPDAQALEQALAENEGRVAGFIFEPLVQGAGGMRMHDVSFLRAARAACDAHGVLLIADEVMTGFGRTGAMFACSKAGITPDLICLAKGLTSGMLPLAVTLSTEAIFEAFHSPDRTRFFPHGHSMTANPIGCAVALASIELCRENDTPARLDAIGRRIHAALEDFTADPRVTNLRRTGGIVAFDIDPPAGGALGYHADLVPPLRAAAIEEGVLLRPLGNTLYALPPACTTDEQCDAIATAMRRVVERTVL